MLEKDWKEFIVKAKEEYKKITGKEYIPATPKGKGK